MLLFEMVHSGPGVCEAGPADMTGRLLKILSIMDFQEVCSGGLPGTKVLGTNQTLEPISFIPQRRNVGFGQGAGIRTWKARQERMERSVKWLLLITN